VVRFGRPAPREFWVIDGEVDHGAAEANLAITPGARSMLPFHTARASS
jgi:hypothetical protein